MEIKIDDLSKQLVYNKTSLYTYLCRAEFSHIVIKKGILHNITEKDIYRLKELIARRR